MRASACGRPETTTDLGPGGFSLNSGLRDGEASRIFGMCQAAQPRDIPGLASGINASTGPAAILEAIDHAASPISRSSDRQVIATLRGPTRSLKLATGDLPINRVDGAGGRLAALRLRPHTARRLLDGEVRTHSGTVHCWIARSRGFDLVSDGSVFGNPPAQGRPLSGLI